MAAPTHLVAEPVPRSCHTLTETKAMKPGGGEIAIFICSGVGLVKF